MTLSLFGPNGTPMAELGGERAWLQRVLHGFVCSFQWLDTGLDDGPEACMVLFKEGRTMDPPAYAIPQRHAFMYASREGNATPATMGVAFKACVQLELEPDPSRIRLLMDIIIEAIPDLVKMPSEQPADLHVARVLHGIEVSARMNGRALHSEVI